MGGLLLIFPHTHLDTQATRLFRQASGPACIYVFAAADRDVRGVTAEQHDSGHAFVSVFLECVN